MSSNNYPRDREVARNRQVRMVVAGVVTAVVIFVPPMVLTIIGGMVRLPVLLLWPGILISLYAGIRTAIKIAHHILAIVPEWQGLVTQNYLTGGMVIYGPGIHPRLPWEVATEAGHHSLEKVTIERMETYPTQDDEVKLKGQIIYQAFLPYLHIFHGVDETTVEKAFWGRVSEYLQRKLKSVSADIATGKGERNLSEEMERELPGLFSDEESLRTYGVRVLEINIPDIDFSEEVKKARSALSESHVFLETVAEIYGLEIGGLREKIRSGDLPRSELQEMIRHTLAVKGEASVETKAIDLSVASIKGLLEIVKEWRK